MNKNKPPFALNPLNALVVMLMMASPIAMADTDQKNTADQETATTKKATDAKGTKTSADKKVLPELTVSKKVAPNAKETYKLPATTESITSDKIDESINAMSTEDVIKYMPSIQVRKRYIGDTNAPVGWRTSGTSASARGLIYGDGILLSSLLGNNNGNTGSPRWNMIAPSEIERVDVMYGPYSAAYSGNSIGGVIDIKTKMPEKFEAGADVKSTWQDYGFYGKKQTFDSQEYSFNVGDRIKDFSFRFDASHLDSHSQPITFNNPLVSTTNTIAGDKLVTGAISNQNPYGKNAVVLGSGFLNHSVQDNFKWKLGYDLTDTIHAAYTLGLWQNDNNAGFDSYLRDTAGNVVNSGKVNIGGKQYDLGSSFAETRAEQMHWSHGMNLKSDSGGVFDWDLSGSVVDYGTDLSRTATVAPSSLAANPAGRVTSLTGTGWNTADAKGIWRPAAHLLGKHEVSFGFHHDYYELNNPVYNVTNWAGMDSSNSIYQNSQGKTQTEGYWAQDSLDFNKEWNFTLGGRLENWHAFDGYNATAAASTKQSEKNDLTFSPKAKLTWKPTTRVQSGLSIGQAYRFPTVTELYQSTTATSGSALSFFGNPNLKPEEALSSEWANEYFLDNGKLRLSLFQERVKDAIFSQSTVLPNTGGSYTSYSQNVGETQTYGVEVAGEASDVGIRGLDLYANATWADSRITDAAAIDAEAAALPNSSSNPYVHNPATGKRQPRVPEWRASATIAYRPIDKLTTSVSGRYSSPQSGQLNNSDFGNLATYQSGGTEYFIVDLHAKYQITKQFSTTAGIDNVNNEQVWLYHPFPSRTYFAQLKFNY